MPQRREAAFWICWGQAASLANGWMQMGRGKHGTMLVGGVVGRGRVIPSQDKAQVAGMVRDSPSMVGRQYTAASAADGALSHHKRTHLAWWQGWQALGWLQDLQKAGRLRWPQRKWRTWDPALLSSRERTEASACCRAREGHSPPLNQQLRSPFLTWLLVLSPSGFVPFFSFPETP